MTNEFRGLHIAYNNFLALIVLQHQYLLACLHVLCSIPCFELIRFCEENYSRNGELGYCIYALTYGNQYSNFYSHTSVWFSLLLSVAGQNKPISLLFTCTKRNFLLRTLVNAFYSNSIVPFISRRVKFS